MSCEDIPSLLDLQKVKKHADDFGRLMGTGTGTSTNEVTGQVRPTYNAVMANLGYTRVGTFAAGATLLNGRQTLLWDVADGGDGQEYGWSGVFPPAGKVVPPGSTPLTTGGIAVGAWMSRFDPELRTQVLEALRRSYAEAGYNLVDGSFEVGGTLVNANDVLLQERTGKAFTGPVGVVAAGTNPTIGGFVDISRKLSVLVFDIANYGAVADGVQPATNAPLGTPATGTDNSSAIKAAVAAAQLAVSSGVAQGSIDPAVEVLITTSVKGLYRVDGTNLFGWQFPQGSQTANVKMRVDLRGSSILWNVPVGGVFIDNAYALYAPKYCGYSLFLFGFTGQRGVFFRTNNPPLATFNPLQSPVFEGLVVRGGSAANEGRAATLGNHFDAIFDITAGTNLCDRGLIENCTFYQWSTFFRSANKEAVGWSIDDSSTLMSYVDGATLCSWTVPWSGNMRFDNSDIIMKGANQTLFKATDSTGVIPIYNSGEIAISCRIETNSSGVKLVEATHGAYRFSVANFAAGNSSPGNNTIGDVLGIASVSFDNCINVPDSVTVSAFAYSGQLPASYYSVFVAPNCAVYGDALSIDRVLVWGSGFPLEYIAAINSGYYIPNILCDARLPLVAGRTPNAKMQLLYRELSYGFNTSAGNSVVNAANNSFSIKLPPQMLVDKINMYVTSVSAATADSIGCYIDDVLFNTIGVSPSNATRVSALPLNQVLTNSSKSAVNLSFKPLLAGNIVSGETILFKAFIRVRGFIDKNDTNSSGNVVLISDRNPTW